MQAELPRDVLEVAADGQCSRGEDPRRLALLAVAAQRAGDIKRRDREGETALREFEPAHLAVRGGVGAILVLRAIGRVGISARGFVAIVRFEQARRTLRPGAQPCLEELQAREHGGELRRGLLERGDSRQQ